MPRPHIALIPYVVAVCAVIAGLLWHAADQLPGLGRLVSTGEAMVGGPFTLTDQNGEARSSADFRGRFMLIYFGYTYCPDVCPTTLGGMADAMDRMGGLADKVVPIFISIDPARDTPPVLKAYLKSFGPRFVALTGTREQIAHVAKSFHVYVKKNNEKNSYSVDHSSVIYLMGPNGKFASYYDGAASPDALAADLKSRM